MKIFFIIFLFCCCMSSCEVKAQYADYFKITDLRGAFVYDIVMRKVIDKDVHILKENNVKSVVVRGDSGKVTSKFSVNEDGWITNYSTYEYNDGEEINYEITYDGSRPLTIKYKEKGMGINYTCFYKDNHLEYINADFGSKLAEDCVFSFSNKDKIDRIDYIDKLKDTVYMTIHFLYDSKDKLVSTKDIKFDNVIDTISYSENVITINRLHFEEKKYTLNDNRITEEQNTFPSKQLQSKSYSYQTEIPDIVSKYRYYYKDNGLIEYIDAGTDNFKYKYIYEYEYYQ
ncbi:MAG: hypothetical protein JST55_14710 [Bacteroidetes bacterium]|nr:hypothetical protein [Bacteroidota bacterium]